MRDEPAKPMIVEIDKATDRRLAWTSGFIYGLAIGGLAGFIVALRFFS